MVEYKSVEEREKLKSINFNVLYNEARLYYNKQEISFLKVYKYYIMQPDHVDITPTTLKYYYKKFLNKNFSSFNFDYKKMMKEPYKGNNKVILYYLNQLESDDK